MIGCLVTVGTAEVVTVGIHVNINVFVRVIHAGIEVTMLDGITTATEEVAVPTVLAGAFANVTGNVEQVSIRSRHTGSSGWFLYDPVVS